MFDAGAGALAADWMLKYRGLKVPISPEESHTDKATYEGPRIQNAPKFVSPAGATQGHSEALKPRIPPGIK